MSLKAKIEAVIYASEEPVTLAQLIGLLGLEAQAELDHQLSAQQSLSLEDAPASTSEDGLDPDAPDQKVNDPEPTSASESPEPAQTPEDAPGNENQPEPPSEEASAAKAGREEKEAARRLRDFFRSLLDQLIADYATSDRGLEIREVAGGYRLATKPEYHDAVRGFVKSLKPPLKLSLQALETLAVVAYKQPVTAPEISEIRGVDSGGVLGSLMARKLITTAGRKQVIGRPILYKTTRDFLLRFGLKDINELPSIEEFEKMAGELADEPILEAIQEEIPMPAKQSMNTTDPAETPHTDPEFSRRNYEDVESITGANLEEEREAIEPQADGDSSNLDTVPVDGRESGPPPPYDDSDDPSAEEARIQQDESK